MKKIFFLSILILCQLLTANCYAQIVYTLTEPKEPVSIGKYFVFMIDSTSRMTIEEASKSSNYNAVTKDIPAFDVDANIWGQIKFISAKQQDYYLTIGPPNLRLFSVFQKTGKGKWEEIKNGSMLRASSKELLVNHFFYKLNIQTGDTLTFIFKAQEANLVSFDIQVGTSKAFYTPFHDLDFYNGICIGIIIMMLLYNLFLLILQREKEYLWYVMYLATTLVILPFSVLGYSNYYPEWIFKIYEVSSAFFPVAPAIFLMLFIMELFKGMLPRWLIILNYAFIVSSFMCIIISIPGYERLATKLVLIQNSLIIIPSILAGIFALRKKHSSAVYYLIGYGIFLTGFTVLILTFMGAIDINVTEAFKVHTAGTAFECVMLSFALGNKLKVSQKEREEAQKEALKQANENERLIREQNLTLEQKVNERTKQLSEANEELNQQNEEIASQRDQIEHQKELVEEQKKEMVDSITYAKRIQDAILPPINFIKEKLPESFVLYKPKDIVAGDFYWMEEIQLASNNAKNNRLINPSTNRLILIASADCTGHGVPGAMVSVVCSNALNRAVKEFKLTDPGKILDKVTDLVLETFEKSNEDVKDGMDISILSIEYRDMSIETYGKKSEIKNQESEIVIKWAGANNPLWYFTSYPEPLSDGREGGKRNDYVFNEIKADKQPIGKSDHRKPFTTHTISLTNEESNGGATTFYLFTDGYADQFGGPKGKKLKYKQLQESIVSVLDTDLSVQKEHLETLFTNWKDKLEQVDDVCIIGIRL